MFSFENQVCLITGAGSPTGIGFATAKALGLLGGKIYMIATSDRIFERANELKELGIDAKGVICDLRDASQVTRTIEEIEKESGKIDVLVNNAGINSTSNHTVYDKKSQPNFAELEDDDWYRVLDINMKTNYNVSKNVLKIMKKNKYGRIVHISSVTGPIVTQRGLAAYATAKSAILGMSKTIALEEGINNITSNAVLPGWINTGILDEASLKYGEYTPIGRPARAEEVASAVVFFASKEASYVTGQELIVDGGNVIQECKGV